MDSPGLNETGRCELGGADPIWMWDPERALDVVNAETLGGNGVVISNFNQVYAVRWGEDGAPSSSVIFTSPDREDELAFAGRSYTEIADFQMIGDRMHVLYYADNWHKSGNDQLRYARPGLWTGRFAVFAGCGGIECGERRGGDHD